MKQIKHVKEMTIPLPNNQFSLPPLSFYFEAKTI